MVEDIIAITERVLLWDEFEKSSYGANICKKLFSLPIGSTLYINMKNVEYIDEKYAFYTIAMFQCSSGRGPLKGKHLIIVEPSPTVLQSIENAVNDADTAFLYLNNKGMLQVGGKAFSPSLRAALIEALRSREPLSAKILSDILKIENVQTCGNYLKKLYDWGFICRAEVRQKTLRKTKQAGRPMFSYYPYWPNKGQAWEIRSLEKEQKPVLFYRPKHAKVVGA